MYSVDELDEELSLLWMWRRRVLEALRMLREKGIWGEEFSLTGEGRFVCGERVFDEEGLFREVYKISEKRVREKVGLLERIEILCNRVVGVCGSVIKEGDV